MVEDRMTIIVPPEVIVVRDFEEFLEKGQPVEAGLTDEQADSVSPMDLLSSDNYTTKEIRNERFDVCKGCDRLFKPTRTCRECGCFMALKTWLKDAACPKDKWL
jgi:hypothetical protein